MFDNASMSAKADAKKLDELYTEMMSICSQNPEAEKELKGINPEAADAVSGADYDTSDDGDAMPEGSASEEAGESPDEEAKEPLTIREAASRAMKGTGRPAPPRRPGTALMIAMGSPSKGPMMGGKKRGF